MRVFENRVLRRVFGPKRDEVTGEWRKLYNEEINDLYSPNTVRAIKSRMRWAGHVALMGEGRGAYRSWWEEVREIDHVEVLDVDGRMIIKIDIQKVGWGRMDLVTVA